MAENNGKKELSEMDVELRAIRRVAKAVEDLTPAQKMRVVDYVRATLINRIVDRTGLVRTAGAQLSESLGSFKDPAGNAQTGTTDPLWQQRP